MRLMALETLGKMDAATLAKHAAAIVAKFEDSMGEVRFSARLMMHKIEPAAGHLAAVLEGLQDRTFEQEPHDYPGRGRLVCMKAVQALGKLEAAALAPHGPAIRKMAERAASAATARADTQAAAGRTLEQRADDERSFVEALGKLQAAAARAETGY